MSVSFQLPPQARLITTSTIFTAPFNVPTPGKYDFTNTPACQNVSVLELQPNSVYFIDRMSAGGNITEEQFLESIDSFPLLYLKKSIRIQNVYMLPIPIANYFDGNETSAWVWSDKKDDFLQFSFQGVLNQLPSMVGIASVKMQVTLNIFAVESSWYNATFRDQLAKSIGQVNRR
jgi:hypothetical protein